jgi:hypothetical protein
LFGRFELFDLITIICSVIITILSLIDLIRTYNNETKSKTWEYSVGSISFFLPLLITHLQWKYERNRNCILYPTRQYSNIFQTR